MENSWLFKALLELMEGICAHHVLQEMVRVQRGAYDRRAYPPRMLTLLPNGNFDRGLMMLQVVSSEFVRNLGRPISSSSMDIPSEMQRQEAIIGFRRKC